MILTDKCKKMFEEWYKKGSNFTYLNKISYMPKPEVFPILPFEFQQGVYLEFLREQGIIIIIDSAWESGLATGFFYQIIQDSRLVFDDNREIFPDYNTALTQAIDKACELCGKELK